ncbi:acyl carrier protein [Collinsella sp. zg1085]|uniref:acyl carrier protein n=1 Tax=Collinsella sp. zg1085 TaxID=2844380 RepID=UPI001C0C99F3|nr:acyl carrier protein [Collinsella sp. zg1085]QWT17183.1 acyl carrier protein [Collinsella sp. zg1085]
MNEFQEEVVDILKNKAAEIFGVDAATLSEKTSFVDDLHAKSVNIVQFASALEDEYEVEVPYMELNKMATFADAAQFIDDKLSM